MAKLNKDYDFSGWATRNDVRCSDGRTIKKDAFKHNDGETVPLVWNHNHNDADNVLGHALLENRNEGVYAYCSFNDTEQGRNAKELVKHGDVRSLSIYANQLKQNGGDVIHGAIREVSLVLAGANPGARIETVLVHSDGANEELDAVIWNASETLELSHNDETEKPANDEEEKSEMNNQENVQKVDEIKTEPEASNEINHADEGKVKTIKDVFDTLNEEQKTVVYALIGQAIEDAKNEINVEGDNNMKHNAFENENVQNEENVLTHSEFAEIANEAKSKGSMKETFLAHGITNVEVLFPEAQAVNKTPEMIQREMSWVDKVMRGVKHTPFSRVKSTAANITADEARARGYIKGKKKVEEVITALKRSTTPTTIYKLQKMDRDDVIDITDFDVVAWLKQEMRMMLNEEIARAILIGDGRSTSSDDHINTQNIRPVLGDDSTYSVAKIMERESTDNDSTFAKKFIKLVVKARKDYKGSGNPTLFVTEDLLTDMLLIEDKNERVIYDTVEKLKTALRVSDIVTVPVFDGQVREGETNDFKLMGILVNLLDYVVGADKGGEVNMFDDFDINYNKYEYLIETRISGALVKPFSAITFEEKVAKSAE